MANIAGAVADVRLLDGLARRQSPVHKLHPLTKLMTTVAFLAVVLSFGRAQIAPLLPLLFYPLALVALSDVPFGPIAKRVLAVEPFVLFLGILNPVLDRAPVALGTVQIAHGWLTFASLAVKTGLTVSAALLLIATTGMDKLSGALRLLRVPKLFVLQLQMTYRYLSVLLEEAGRLLRAYSLRAPGQKGVARAAWGSLAGSLLLRTFDRAQRVYDAMRLRGFSGEYPGAGVGRFTLVDALFFVGWGAFFAVCRMFNLPALIGSLFTGV